MTIIALPEFRGDLAKWAREMQQTLTSVLRLLDRQRPINFVSDYVAGTISVGAAWTDVASVDIRLGSAPVLLIGKANLDSGDIAEIRILRGSTVLDSAPAQTFLGAMITGESIPVE